MKAVKVLIVLVLFGAAGYIYLGKAATTAEVPVSTIELKFPGGNMLSVLKPKISPKGFGDAPVVFFKVSEAPVKIYTYEQGEDKTYMVEGGGTKLKVPAGSATLVSAGNIKTSGKYTDKEIADSKSLMMLAVKCGFDQ